MDAYLSEEASLFLRALAFVSPEPKAEGFLIGHKRGPRIFIEQILPTQKGFFSSPRHFLAANQALQDRVIGFFSFSSEPRPKRKILQAFAYGKIFLNVQAASPKKWKMRAFAIAFEKRFFFQSIPLHSFQRGKK